MDPADEWIFGPNSHVLRPAFDGPDHAAPGIDGYSDEDPDYGPSDDEDKDLCWRHSKRSMPVTLEDADERCRLTVEDDDVLAEYQLHDPPGLAGQHQNRWRRASAFVSQWIASADVRTAAEHDEWVVKVVHCPQKLQPQVKHVRG